jgi:hypothetical protein
MIFYYVMPVDKSRSQLNERSETLCEMNRFLQKDRFVYAQEFYFFVEVKLVTPFFGRVSGPRSLYQPL